MKKDKEESPRHTIIITLGEMGQKKTPSMEDEEDNEGEEEGGDVGDKIVRRMIKKNKKMSKEKC